MPEDTVETLHESETSLQNSYCCKLDEILQIAKKRPGAQEAGKNVINILYAQKTQGDGSGYIVYCIRTDSVSKRRMGNTKTKA
jgi:hypothetical protein